MELIAECEDQEIRRLLGGSEGDVGEGFERLDKRYRERFWQIIRKRLPRLNPEDFADAWQDTMKGLLEALRAGRLLLRTRLFPWLWTVFHRRVYDQAEGMEKRRRIWEHVKRRLQGTDVGGAVEGLGPPRRLDLLARIRDVVKALSPRQRLVVETFLEGYPLTEDRMELRRRVSEKSGQDLSPRAVSSAMWHARSRVKSLLSRSGD